MVFISVECHELVTEKVISNAFPCQYQIHLKDYLATFNDHDW